MNDRERIVKPGHGLLQTDISGSELLEELALDLHWTWHHASDAIWRELDAELWELTRNPWTVLQTTSRDKIERVLADAALRDSVDALVRRRRQHLETPAWFQEAHPESALNTVAYFSMEFMLSEALPIYSGGLGNVAGDQLKASSDLGVPVVAVGLLYQQGYFRQVVGTDGAQQELFPYNDPAQLPITPVRTATGGWLRLEVALPGYSLWLRAWQAQVGRARLYLLDSNDLANFPAHRGITSELYGGGPQLRLQQEVVLGIGGWKLLEALGLEPEVCHLNEGHAAFAILERARTFMQVSSKPFDVALATTRAGNLFTTHTAVPAGFDRFDPFLIEQHLGRYAERDLGISTQDLLALGRKNPRDASEPFNMALLAVRGSGAVNAVSRIHGQVSRKLFGSLFPRWPEAEVPIGHVTNGVHVPTWNSQQADELWTEACGDERWQGDSERVADDFRRVSDERLWQFRMAASVSLVECARRRLARQLTASGEPAEAIARARHVLDPGALTLGFARRFATYKRPGLLLHDRERLVRILGNARRPVQLVIAGKAHPNDGAGKALIQQWVRFVRRPEVRPRAVFLEDYDMQLTEHLVQGVDVWLNTPRRPWEACGTSGMKVLVNGGLNVSERDGWWAEAYSAEVGWALGDDEEHDADPSWDAKEADALYDLLEREVIPSFFERNDRGIPAAWVSRMRESMARLTPRFCANRAVREYTTRHYLPAAEAFRARARDAGAEGERLVQWRRSLARSWSNLRFGALQVESTRSHHTFGVQVFLGELDAKSVCVELYADGVEGRPATRQAMALERSPAAPGGYHFYRGTVPSARPKADFTARAVPRFEGASLPLESSEILWQR